MAKLSITTVADPMMGMLWETWPIKRKLETHFGDQIEFHTLMGQLVKNVYDLADSKVVEQYGKKVALNQYWTRLMQVYLQEEEISGMPIFMGGGRPLFDSDHTSSLPLNIGLRAIAGNDLSREDQVLYEMQYDTVVADRQTTDQSYLKKLAAQFNVSVEQFNQRFQSDQLSQQLDQEAVIMQQMKVDRLPAYLVTYQDRSYVIKGIPQYQEWLKLIQQITEGAIKPRLVTFDMNAVKQFMVKHPHISSLELKEAFDTDEETVIKSLAGEDLDRVKVKNTVFYRTK